MVKLRNGASLLMSAADSKRLVLKPLNQSSDSAQSAYAEPSRQTRSGHGHGTGEGGLGDSSQREAISDVQSRQHTTDHG